MVIRGKVWRHSHLGSRPFTKKFNKIFYDEFAKVATCYGEIYSHTTFLIINFLNFLNDRLSAHPKDDDNTADLLIMYSTANINVDNDEFSFGVVKYRYDALPVTRSSKIKILITRFLKVTFHNFPIK